MTDAKYPSTTPPRKPVLMLARPGIPEAWRLPTEDVPVGLRNLRLWHWYQVRFATKRMNDNRGTRFTKRDAQQAWNFHMGAVQMLNDFFPLGDTAEEDEVKAQEKKRRAG